MVITFCRMFISCLMFAFIAVLSITYMFSNNELLIRYSIFTGATIGILIGWYTRKRTIPGILSALIAVVFYIAAVSFYIVGSMFKSDPLSVLFLSATPIPMAAGTLALLMHRSTFEELKEIVRKKAESQKDRSDEEDTDHVA